MTTKERRWGVRRQFFSFRDLVQRKRRNKMQGDIVHQVGAGPGVKIARDLVQRKRRNKVQREFVHQVGAAPGGKIARDLVQRKRRNKVQRDIVHQVLGRAWRKNRPRFGAKETEEQGAAGFRAPSRRRPRPEKSPGTWCKGNGGTRVSGNSCTKSAPAPEEKSPGLGAKETKEQGSAGFRAPSPRSPPGRRPVTSPKAPPPPAARLQPPRPVVKSTHMSTIPFPRIIIKFA